MMDWVSMHERMLERLQPFSRQEIEVMDFLMALEAERERDSLRRRLAGLIVRLGLRLDPEVTIAVPVRARA